MADAATRGGGLPVVAILFEQFAQYHVDRVDAAARRLEGRAEVLAVEFDGTPAQYAWERAGPPRHARHVTLFPGRLGATIPPRKRLRAAWQAVASADRVLIGVPYSQPDIVLLSWRLAAGRRRPVLMSDSKFDDRPRRHLRETAKARLLAPYGAAIVSGRRTRDYLQFLGFTGKPVLPGYATVGLDRVRADGAGQAIPWAARDFLFAGRFVARENLPTLLRAYARYRALAGPRARRLTMVGDGPLMQDLRDRAGEGVHFAGSLRTGDVARRMARALALCLVPSEEQFGLAVNEAAAFGVPAIVSNAVGARELLVRSGAAGFVVEPNSVEGIAQAMFALSCDEAIWQRHSMAVAARADLGDAERFADAVEALLDPPDRWLGHADTLWRRITRD